MGAKQRKKLLKIKKAEQKAAEAAAAKAAEEAKAAAAAAAKAEQERQEAEERRRQAEAAEAARQQALQIEAEAQAQAEAKAQRELEEALATEKGNALIEGEVLVKLSVNNHGVSACLQMCCPAAASSMLHADIVIKTRNRAMHQPIHLEVDCVQRQAITMPLHVTLNII